ncbi:TonB-dependent receptor [Labilibacter sediminis]|nr:TonB-dependent receptor [Labilibacter sediminis]
MKIFFERSRYFSTSKMLVFVLMILFSSNVWAQESINVSGNVSDDTGQSIPGVNVIIKGTTVGTITDMDGNFKLSVTSINDILHFSFIGMDAQDIQVGNKRVFNVILKSGIHLEEVVAVGYGTQRAQDVTGAISKVSVADIEKTTNTTIEQALQGRIAGVNTTSNDGSLGSGIRVRVRGGTSINANNEPLYVIDGIPIEVDYNTNSVKGAMDGMGEDSPLANLDPGSIESMEVLKDASAAAIYGSRGANGVIIITTKSGKSGKTKINVDSKVSVSYVPEDRFVGVMDASQYGTHRINKLQYPEGIYDPEVSFVGELYGQPYTNKEELQALYDNGPNTNWQKEYYGVGIIQNHSLSAYGGKDGNTFGVRGAYLKNEGTLKNSYFERYNFSVNLKNNLTEKLKLVTNLAPSFSDKIGPTSAGGFTSRNMSSVIKTLSRQPNRVVGEIVEDDENEQDGVWVDPVTEALKTQNRTQVFNFNGKADLTYEILNGLSAKVTLGLNYTDSKQKAYFPKEFGRGYQNNGIGTRFHFMQSRLTNQNMLIYKRRLGRHNLNFDALFEQEFLTRDTEYIYNTNFPLEDKGYDGIHYGLTPNIPETYLYKKVMKSYMGRIFYNFDNRVNVNVSFRADGSSVFYKDKWGYFPAMAVSWNVHNENFMDNFSQLSKVKVRASYGQTGNAGIGYYTTYPTMNPQNYVFGVANSFEGGLGAGSVGNPDLRWEFTDQYDVGLELGFFNDRISLDADIYYKETKDLLLNVPTPISTSHDNIIMNNGSVENKGIELSLTTINIDKAFKWSSEFVFAMNRNKVLNLGGQYEQTFRDQFTNGEYTGLLRVGESLGNWVGYKTDGVFTYDDFDIPVLPGGELDYANATLKPEVDELYGNYNDSDPSFGDIRYIDRNKDGLIDSNDKTIIARTQPKHYGSLYNNFSFKGIDLGVFFTYKYGFDVINGNKHRMNFKGNSAWNKTSEFVDAWTPENPEGSYFRPDYVHDGNFTDWVVEDGSFIRLQSINLGYNFPSRIARKIGIRSLKLYTVIDNVYVWTNYSGYDPEVSVATGQKSITSANLDYGAYPRTLNISFGVNIGL